VVKKEDEKVKIVGESDATVALKEIV